MTKKCSKCGRKYKTSQKKKILSQSLCKLLGWDKSEAWNVQNSVLTQDKLESLVQYIYELQTKIKTVRGALLK